MRRIFDKFTNRFHRDRQREAPKVKTRKKDAHLEVDEREHAPRKRSVRRRSIKPAKRKRYKRRKRLQERRHTHFHGETVRNRRGYTVPRRRRHFGPANLPEGKMATTIKKRKKVRFFRHGS